MRASPRQIEVLAVGLILAAAALLLLPHLDDRALWEDEAETALLAERVLRYGVPVAWDGQDLVSQECGADITPSGLWRQTPWLPIYVTAASFRLLGIDTFTARLPSIVLALATLPSLWLLGRRLFSDRLVAPLATAALAASVPFLLYARQSRYYAMVTLAAVWTLIAFFDVLAGRRLAVAGLIITLTVLFHANYLIWVAVVAGLLAAVAFVRPSGAGWLRLGVAGLLTGVVTVPWLRFFDIGGKTGLAVDRASLAGSAHRLVTYLRAIELYMLPAVATAVVLGSVVISRWRRGRPMPEGLEAAVTLLGFSAAYLVALSLAPLLFLRYLVALLPVFALLTAYVVAVLARTRAVVALLVLAFALAVDRAQLLHGGLGSALGRYVDEITHDYDGPVEVLTRFLARESRPGERVWVSYGVLALTFHANVASDHAPLRLDIRGGTSCRPLDGWPPPDWLIVRAVFRLNPLAAGGREDAERARDWVNARLGSGEYRRIELPVVDTAHDALPEPDVHLYRAPTDGRRLSVWKRMRPAAEDHER